MRRSTPRIFAAFIYTSFLCLVLASCETPGDRIMKEFEKAAEPKDPDLSSKNKLEHTLTSPTACKECDSVIKDTYWQIESVKVDLLRRQKDYQDLEVTNLIMMEEKQGMILFQMIKGTFDKILKNNKDSELSEQIGQFSIHHDYNSAYFWAEQNFRDAPSAAAQSILSFWQHNLLETKTLLLGK